LELLKSLNGIGSSTTSSREQNIVNVVSLVVPDACQRPLTLIQPLPAPGIVVLPGFQRDSHHRVFRQLQRLKRPEFPSFVNGSDGDCHARSTPAISLGSIPFTHHANHSSSENRSKGGLLRQAALVASNLSIPISPNTTNQ
jgi:hypothetical protein